MDVENKRKSKTTLSVLMSVYKLTNPDKLRRSLESIEKQTFKEFEFVIVIDGPVQEKVNFLINEFKCCHSKKIIRNNQNIGLGRALNKGLSVITSPYIIRVDDDVVSLPSRFEEQLIFMIKNQHLSLSSAQVLQFSEHNDREIIRPIPVQTKDIYRWSKYRSPINHPSAIFKTEDIKAVGGYPKLRKAQDYGLACLLLKNGYKIQNLDKVLVEMDVGNLSKKRNFKFLLDELKAIWFIYKIKHINLFEFMLSSTLRIFLRSFQSCFR